MGEVQSKVTERAFLKERRNQCLVKEEVWRRKEELMGLTKKGGEIVLFRPSLSTRVVERLSKEVLGEGREARVW